MFSRGYNYKFLPFILIFTIFISTTYRYLRNIPGLENISQILPYLMNAVIAFIVLVLFFVRKLPINNISYIMLFMTLTLTASLTYALLFFGTTSSAYFIGNYILPIFVYFYVILVFKKFELPDLYRFVDGTLFLVFILLTASFSMEFFLNNIAKVDITFLYVYWDLIGNTTYHESAANSILFGRVERPWGIMMMPQSTGGLLAAFSIYYLAEGKKVRSSIAIVLSILSATGTALFVLLIGFVYLFILRFNLKYTIYLLLLIPLMVMMFFFLWQMNDLTYAEYYNGYVQNIFPGTLNNLTVFQWLFGQILDYPILGGGEFRFIKALFRVGLITSVISAVLFFYLLHKLFIYSDFIMKNGNVNKIYSYMIFITLCITSSFHYDLIFRAPVNLLIMMLIAAISLIYQRQSLLILRKKGTI